MLGKGIILGLIETARNFVGSFYDPRRLVTVQYPEERLPMRERSRVFPMLVYDGDDAETGIRCTACTICERECPPQCIYIVMDRDEAGKPLKRPKIYDIDSSVCMNCGICVDVCPFDAIKMNQKFELATDDRFAPLLLTKKELLHPNTYYHQIHPLEAAEVDAQLAAKRKKKETKLASEVSQ